MKNFRASCAGLLTLSMFFSMLSPLSAQALPKHLEKEFREDATLKVERAAKIFNEAKKDFEKLGPKAFVDKLDSLAPKAFTQSEKDFLARKFAKELLLPTLVVKGDRLIGVEAGKEIFNLSTFDVAQGIFNFKDQALRFNPNKRVIENFESWTRHSKQSFFEALLIPRAHAVSKMTGALLGAAIGGLLAWFLWPKVSEWFKGKKETPVDPNDHIQPLASAAPVGAPTEAPPPVNQPSGDPAPQPAAGEKSKEEREGGDKPTPTTQPGTPPTTPAENQAAVDYISQKYPDSEVNTLAEIRAQQTDIKYPQRACKILFDLKNDLTTSINNKKITDKVMAKDVYKYLTEDDKEKEISALNKYLYKKDSKEIKCSDTKEELKKLLST